MSDDRVGSSDMRGRVAVVTGASAGVGRALVRMLAQRGASVGLLARGRAGLEAARREVEEMGGRALAIPTDVADAEAVEAAAAAIEAELGPIDLWINNAMTSVFARVTETTPEEFRRVTEVTYLGYVYGTQAALKRMVPRNRGTIVFVGSALAYRGIPLQAAYCGAKHAIQGFFDSLRTELIHDQVDIHLTMVQLPAVNTPQFGWVKSRLPNKAQPVPPIHQPELAAEAILFAAESDRREVWLGWPTVKAIVGNRVVPWYADRRLAESGMESQQLDEPEDPNRPSNLWHPVDDERDHGAHGGFDQRAKRWTSQFWASKHKGLLMWGGALLAGAALASWSGTDPEDDENGTGRPLRRRPLRTTGRSDGGIDEAITRLERRHGTARA